jgi:hypothetical protein
VLPIATIRERSGCALETLDEMCAGLREHAGSRDETWTSGECALGPRQTSDGPFAEALLIGIRAGYEHVDRDAVRVERPLLGGTVTEPAGHEGQTLVLLTARVGLAWFPIALFHPDVGDDEDAIQWTLDPSGSSLTWDEERGRSTRELPHGYGQVARTIAVVDRGVPLIAAQATIERWRGEVDLACSRACHAAPSPPVDCTHVCSSRVRTTRSWTVHGDVVEIGATEVERTGDHADAMEVTLDGAETALLSAADPGMRFCAFMPVVHAAPRTASRTDPESILALERAHAFLSAGTFRDVHGASRAAQPSSARAIVAIDRSMGSACGGGACTTVLDYRTLEGAMPEVGMSYFASDRGGRVGCDPSALPTTEPTLLEVAPAISRDAIDCGFVGWDGGAEQYWVIVRVLAPTH